MWRLRLSSPQLQHQQETLLIRNRAGLYFLLCLSSFTQHSTVASTWKCAKERCLCSLSTFLTIWCKSFIIIYLGWVSKQFFFPLSWKKSIPALHQKGTLTLCMDFVSITKSGNDNTSAFLNSSEIFNKKIGEAAKKWQTALERERKKNQNHNIFSLGSFIHSLFIGNNWKENKQSRQLNQ